QPNPGSRGLKMDPSPPINAVPGLRSQMSAGLNHNFNLGPEFSSNPYLVYNEMSPNNTGALGKVAVRQALNYGIDRSHLTEDAGGAAVGPPLTHILPPG